MENPINNINIWRAIAIILGIIFILNLAVIHEGFVVIRRIEQEQNRHTPIINWLEEQIRLSQPK